MILGKKNAARIAQLTDAEIAKIVNREAGVEFLKQKFGLSRDGAVSLSCQIIEHYRNASKS